MFRNLFVCVLDFQGFLEVGDGLSSPRFSITNLHLETRCLHSDANERSTGVKVRQAAGRVLNKLLAARAHDLKVLAVPS